MLPPGPGRLGRGRLPRDHSRRRPALRHAADAIPGYRGAAGVPGRARRAVGSGGLALAGRRALGARGAARLYVFTLAAADDRGLPVARHKAFDGKAGAGAGWAVSRDLHKRYGLPGAPELYAAPCPVEDVFYRTASLDFAASRPRAARPRPWRTQYEAARAATRRPTRSSRPRWRGVNLTRTGGPRPHRRRRVPSRRASTRGSDWRRSRGCDGGATTC